MHLRRLSIALAATVSLCFARAQPSVGIAYYDLDHLYDTIPAAFHNDTDYTLTGRLGWTGARYARKVRDAAAVIDSMRLPLVALNSVENEGVVRDIVAASGGDYTYLHRTLNALDGMDFALLYYGDVFFPDYDQTGRGYLYIEGELRIAPQRKSFSSGQPPAPRSERIGLLLVRDVRSAAWVVQELREERPQVKIVVLGRSSSVDCKAWGMTDATDRAAQAGRGNVRARGGWRMRDRILTDTALRVVRADVFARRYLVDSRSGYPIPTYEKQTYRGGISYALPVFVYIR